MRDKEKRELNASEAANRGNAWMVLDQSGPKRDGLRRRPRGGLDRITRGVELGERMSTNACMNR